MRLLQYLLSVSLLFDRGSVRGSVCVVCLDRIEIYEAGNPTCTYLVKVCGYVVCS